HRPPTEDHSVPPRSRGRKGDHPMGTGQRRLSLVVKIATVGGVFLLPIVVLLYAVVERVNGDITFSTLEFDGNAYQRPVEQILDGVQQHQLLLSGCATGADCSAKVTRAAADVASGFGALAS